MGCHFLLQCIKVKSESEVAQLSPTLRNPMDCSLPGSSVHRIFQARVLEWGAITFSCFVIQFSSVQSLSRVQLFATPWTAAYQAPLPMGFSKQEYWSRLPLPSPQVVLVVKKLPANAGDIRDVGLIPGSERSPGGWHGNPFQNSCLENPMDRGA